MPICVRCSKPLICTCSPPPKLGELKLGCSATPGALWIHVLDDQGKDIAAVKVAKNGSGPIPTNVQGLAFYESLPEGDYTADLLVLESPVTDTYEAPVERSKPVKIANGQIAYVPFILSRKAALKARVYYKYDPKRFPRRLFKAAPVTATAENLDTGDSWTCFIKDGVTDFGLVPAGKYEVTAKFAGADAEKFEIEVDKVAVELAPADDRTVEFDVEPIYKTVQFVGHCLLTIPKQLHDGKWKGRYNGHIDDKTDIAARVKFIRTAIEQARSLVDEDPTNLKVFAVPECFFQGRYGAYLSADVEDLITRLQDAVKGEDWKDWIFVFGTVNGVTSTGRTVSGQDMVNMAPVIKGGHGGVEPETFTRLIQKVEFSAELLDKADWKDDWEKMLTRPVALNENIAFTGTENEEKLGRLLQEMFADDATVQQILTDNGLTAAHWAVIKQYLQDEIANAGLLTVVRQLRRISIPAMLASPKFPNGKPVTLADYEFSGFNLQGALRFSNWQSHVGPLVAKKKPKGPFAWRNRDTRASVLQAATLELPNLFADEGISLPYQQLAITQGIANLDPDDVDSIDEVIDERPQDAGYRLSPLPIARKLAELYAAKKGKTAPVGRLEENFDYRDFAFATLRKAGPLLDIDAVAKLPSAKKLNFGVETCADHNKGRLLNALKNVAEPVVIDIQIVPSAGSYPIESTVVARNEGFVFNCDGWVVPSSKAENMRQDRGMFLKVPLVGRPLDPIKNPLTPHTFVGTAGTHNPTGKKEERSLAPEKAAIKPLDPALAEVIFGEGAGELHIYQKKKLPV